jgi:hypothetical protein
MDILSKSTEARPQFEASGGIDAVEKLLYAGTMSPEIEKNIVQIVKIFGRSEGEAEQMELEDARPLTIVFDDVVDANGRLW